MAAGWRGDALGDLALEHEHEALRPRLGAQDVVEDGAGDVVRHVGHQGPGRRHEVAEVDVEDVGATQLETRLAVEALRAGGRRADRRARRP